MVSNLCPVVSCGVKLVSCGVVPCGVKLVSCGVKLVSCGVVSCSVKLVSCGVQWRFRVGYSTYNLELTIAITKMLGPILIQ